MEAQTPRNDDWKKYDKGLSKNIALDDLRESIRQEDDKKIEKAITRCREAGLKDNPRVKEAVEIHQPVIQAKNRLRAACEALKEKGEEEGLKSELQHVKRNHLTEYLLLEVREANSLLERHEAKKHRDKVKPGSLAMDSKTVAEIRRYQNPAKVLHQLVQGVLLLVGEDEDTTDSWKNCQKLCNPYGEKGLCRKVLVFDSSKVHPEIMARAKQLMHGIDFDQVRAIGTGAPIAFYVWAMSAIEKSEAKEKELSEKDGKKKEEHTEKRGGEGDEVKPASRKRQKEIFGRLPKPPENNNFYSANVKTKNKSKPKTEQKSSKPDESANSTGKEKPSKHGTEEGTMHESKQTKATHEGTMAH